MKTLERRSSIKETSSPVTKKGSYITKASRIRNSLLSTSVEHVKDQNLLKKSKTWPNMEQAFASTVTFDSDLQKKVEELITNPNKFRPMRVEYRRITSQKKIVSIAELKQTRFSKRYVVDEKPVLSSSPKGKKLLIHDSLRQTLSKQNSFQNSNKTSPAKSLHQKGQFTQLSNPKRDLKKLETGIVPMYVIAKSKSQHSQQSSVNYGCTLYDYLAHRQSQANTPIKTPMATPAILSHTKLPKFVKTQSMRQMLPIQLEKIYASTQKAKPASQNLRIRQGNRYGSGAFGTNQQQYIQAFK